jgi:murein L,D-transpeptidase YafK
MKSAFVVVFSIVQVWNICFLIPATKAEILSDNPRVAKARKIWSAKIDSVLRASGIQTKDFRMLIMVSKLEQELKIYAGSKQPGERMRLIRSIPVCAISGKPGPKNRQNDEQIPEGFYHINRFNPQSWFHLSVQVSYPNEADVRRNPEGNYGNHIMIHGSCVTIGCIPVTNPGIEELYVFCLKATENGQKKIPVYIFPAWPDAAVFQKLCFEYRDQPRLLGFWQNLQQGYRIFSKTEVPLNISYSKKGSYIFK